MRWPGFAGDAVQSGACAVFALPISVAASHIGALDLFRWMPDPLSSDVLAGGLPAAVQATLPLLDVIAASVGWDEGIRGDDGWEELATLQRVEVYQATGMIMASLDVGAAEAIVRLRGYAFASNPGASEVAAQIVDRQLTFPNDDSWRTGSSGARR